MCVFFSRVVREDGTLAYRYPKSSATPGKIGTHPLLQDYMDKVTTEGSRGATSRKTSAAGVVTKGMSALGMILYRWLLVRILSNPIISVHSLHRIVVIPVAKYLVPFVW